MSDLAIAKVDAVMNIELARTYKVRSCAQAISVADYEGCML